MSPKMRTSKTKGSASLKRSWPRPSRRPEGTAQPVISLINQKGIAIEWTS